MKKRIFSILLCLCMVLMLCPVTAFADESPGILGDLDLDGEVTVKDAVHLQNYLEGLESFENLTHKQLAVADFNGDGVVNYSDWTGLQSYLENDLGLPVSNITVTNGKATACGTKIGKAAEGTRVTLTADSPSDNMEFDKWIVNEGGVTLADASSATTTFTMPAYPVSVTATYKQKYTLAITVDGFEVGKTPADCTYSFESTIPGITFSKDDIKYIGWHKYAANGGYYPVTNDDAFRAGTLYRCVIDLDRNGLTEVPVVTVNGNTPNYCTFLDFAGVPELSIGCDLGTPAAPGSLAITVNGFEVGKTPADCTYTFESTNLGVTFSEDDILLVRWVKEGEREGISETEAFEAGVSYQIMMNLGNKGLDTAPAVTVNGKTPEYCTIATSNDVPIQLQVSCKLGTPPITLTVPFTTTVKLGGNVAPGETTFELALIDSAGNELTFDDQYFFAEITTDGAGEYEGELTITGPESQLWNMLSDGVFVQQVNAGAPNWTYDDTVWGLYLKNFAELAADDAAPEYTVLIFLATCEKTDNGMFYSMVDGANAVARMIFTNTYTYSAPARDTATIVIGGEKEGNKPVEENPNTGALDNVPQTGGGSSLTLWFALLAISAAGVIGTGVYCKRRRSSQAK